jgi:hypothetical protein
VGIQNKLTDGTQLSKVQIFEVEFEAHLVSLCAAKSQPIGQFFARTCDRHPSNGFQLLGNFDPGRTICDQKEGNPEDNRIPLATVLV